MGRDGFYGIFLDLETTGLSVRSHRVLEIALSIYRLFPFEHIGTYEQCISQPREVWEQSDPKSLKVNGLNEKVHRGLPEPEVAQQIVSFLERHQLNRSNSVFICQNPSFDRMFFDQLIPSERQEEMQWPYHWLDLASMFFAKQQGLAQSNESVPQPWQVGLSKNDIASHHLVAPEHCPHRASGGMLHLVHVYKVLFCLDRKEAQQNRREIHSSSTG